MRFPRLRLSVRALCAVVLAIGVGLGWVAHRARVQRDAVAAIERSIGRVTYDWQWTPPPQYPWIVASRRPRATSRPPGPKWAVDALGVDYFSTVKKVIVRRDADAAMAHVGQLGGLGELELPGIAPVSDAGLAPLRGLTRLESLQIHSAKVTGAGLANVERLTRLRRLSFNDGNKPPSRKPIRLADADLAHLARLDALEELQLQPGDAVSDAGIAHLKGLVRLRRLTLGGPRITARGLAHLGGMNRLNELEISPSQIDDLAPIRHLTWLTALGLESSPLDDRGLAPVAGLVGLTSLNLTDTRVGDAGLAHLRGLGLSYLDLAGTAVTDAGLAHLEGMTSLMYLDLSDTRVTDAGLSHLARLARLTLLELNGTRVTAAGHAALSRDLPGVAVLRYARIPR